MDSCYCWGALSLFIGKPALFINLLKLWLEVRRTFTCFVKDMKDQPSAGEVTSSLGQIHRTDHAGGRHFVLTYLPQESSGNRFWQPESEVQGWAAAVSWAVRQWSSCGDIPTSCPGALSGRIFLWSWECSMAMVYNAACLTMWLMSSCVINKGANQAWLLNTWRMISLIKEKNCQHYCVLIDWSEHLWLGLPYWTAHFYAFHLYLNLPVGGVWHSS